MSSPPKRMVPFRKNCTPATPTLSEALALTVTVPDTIAPSAGAVTVTVGLIVSGTASAVSVKKPLLGATNENAPFVTGTSARRRKLLPVSVLVS